MPVESQSLETLVAFICHTTTPIIPAGDALESIVERYRYGRVLKVAPTIVIELPHGVHVEIRPTAGLIKAKDCPRKWIMLTPWVHLPTQSPPQQDAKHGHLESCSELCEFE